MLARAVLARVVGEKRKPSAPAKPRYTLEPFSAGQHAGERTVEVVAQVHKHKVVSRAPTPPAKAVGATDPMTGFDRGHVIGLHLGGANISENVVPMYPSFNRVTWKALENFIKGLRDDKTHAMPLTMTVRMTYGGDDPRLPSSFDVEVTDAHMQSVGKWTLSQPDVSEAIGAVPDHIAGELTKSKGKLQLSERPASAKAEYPDKPENRPYGYLDDLVAKGKLTGVGAMTAGRDFTTEQRTLILQVNSWLNLGHLVSDDEEDERRDLDVAGTQNVPEIDHIIPKVLGGSNQFSNARVVSWFRNNKSARIKPIGKLIDLSRLSAPALTGNKDKQARDIATWWVAKNPGVTTVTPQDLKDFMTKTWGSALGVPVRSALWSKMEGAMTAHGVVLIRRVVTAQRTGGGAPRAGMDLDSHTSPAEDPRTDMDVDSQASPNDDSPPTKKRKLV